jgi:hypothetical protein
MGLCRRARDVLIKMIIPSGLRHQNDRRAGDFVRPAGFATCENLLDQNPCGMAIA